MKHSALIPLATLSLLCSSLIAFDPYFIEIGSNRIEIEPEMSFFSVLATISQELDSCGPFQIELAVSGSSASAKVASFQQGVPRDYYTPITTQEKEDLSHILKTLANSNLLKIGASESTLKKTGERIEHLHPLKFLKIVFTDEELKVCIRNLQGRSWVWKEFQRGIIGSFATEAGVGNLLPDQITDFAGLVGISPNVMIPLIDGAHWSELLDTLIATVPRKPGGKKYDM